MKFVKKKTKSKIYKKTSIINIKYIFKKILILFKIFPKLFIFKFIYVSLTRFIIVSKF